MTRRPISPALSVTCAFVLLGACAPPRTLASGVNGYSTDIVLGSQTRPVTPPPVPLASKDPTFPSFIVPSPPAAPPSTGTTVPAPPVAPPVSLRLDPCPLAGPNETVLRVTPDVAKPPAEGVFSYRQHGSYQLGGKDQGPLPSQSARMVAHVTPTSNGGFTYDVGVTQFGSTTTTTYELVRRVGQSDVDGIYITHTVMVGPDKRVQDFSPVAPGLKILPVPSRVGATWSSVATDPVHGTSTRLDGVVREVGRVDACGKLAEGWFSLVKIATRLVGAPENVKDLTIDAGYVIANQLGGLILADNSSLTGTDGGRTVTQQTDSVINALVPVGPVAKR